MKSIEELERRYEEMTGKKESLSVSIANLHDRMNKLTEILRCKKAKLKEVNIRCDKLERCISPESQIEKVKSRRFHRMAKEVLPTRLYEDICREAGIL